MDLLFAQHGLRIRLGARRKLFSLHTCANLLAICVYSDIGRLDGAIDPEDRKQSLTKVSLSDCIRNPQSAQYTRGAASGATGAVCFSWQEFQRVDAKRSGDHDRQR